ncbi:hypothetical protein OPT61_g3768 [Boeremia exigua]|uniref:Uncharacterized protein n=1 Tax=Boeremia exigua TaxID=749465 RepID=A0ACC2IGP3_9PLEO|nr:hypothetical protein OPT61_g3768 [Boeremia exigua]
MEEFNITTLKTKDGYRLWRSFIRAILTGNGVLDYTQSDGAARIAQQRAAKLIVSTLDDSITARLPAQDLNDGVKLMEHIRRLFESPTSTYVPLKPAESEGMNPAFELTACSHTIDREARLVSDEIPDAELHVEMRNTSLATQHRSGSTAQTPGGVEIGIKGRHVRVDSVASSSHFNEVAEQSQSATRPPNDRNSGDAPNLRHKRSQPIRTFKKTKTTAFAGDGFARIGVHGVGIGHVHRVPMVTVFLGRGCKRQQSLTAGAGAGAAYPSKRLIGETLATFGIVMVMGLLRDGSGIRLSTACPPGRTTSREVGRSYATARMSTNTLQALIHHYLPKTLPKTLKLHPLRLYYSDPTYYSTATPVAGPDRSTAWLRHVKAHFGSVQLQLYHADALLLALVTSNLGGLQNAIGFAGGRVEAGRIEADRGGSHQDT